MFPIKLTKLHFSEIKQEICVEVGIISSENQITLQCSNNQLVTFDIFDSTVLTDLPFNVNYAEIPQSHDSSLLKKADVRESYKNFGLLEQQRLVLEPSCVAQFSSESLKVNALQFKRTQWSTTKEKPLAVIVTVSGLCRILHKLPAPCRNWSAIYNVDEYIFDNMLSTKTNNHADNVLNECRITAATWHKTETMLFVSFERGYIAVLTFCNLSAVKIKEHFMTKTTLGEICDITSFDHYLLVSSTCGRLQLLSVNYKSHSITLTPLTVLWNQRDNMTCNKLLVTKFSLSIYLVVFNKGSHILAFVLSVKGEVLCSTKLYIGGVKVTGVQFISSSEFILTTITSTVRYFRVNFFDHNEIKLNEQNVEIDLGSPNLGILGFVCSENCSLLTFILLRNGEYSQHCKYLHNSVFVNISKLERMDIFKQLSKAGLGAMNPSQDCVTVLGMDIFDNINHDQYSSFYDIMNTQLPDILDNRFLLQLQIKFALVSNLLSLRRWKRKKKEESTTVAHKLLFNAIQICHIICRLKHLFSLEFIALSSFQQECINIFIKKYTTLICKLKRSLLVDRLLEHTRERYLNFFTKCFKVDMNEKAITWNERCYYCNEPTNPDTMVCDKNHKVKRCYVSYKQLPVISSRHCPRCQYYVLEDESLLKQLFTANENITCTFCRFYFVEDCV